MVDFLGNARLVVHHFPGAIASMAPQIGKCASTLEKELRGAAGFKLGLVDAGLISSIAVQHRTPHALAIVNAFATGAGRMVELPMRYDEPTEDLYSTVSGLVEQASTSLTDVTLAMRDGVVSDRELADIRRDIAVLISKGQDLLENCVRNNERNKPRSAVRAA